MCQDCEPPPVSRRRLLWTPPVALLASSVPDLAGRTPARAAEQTVETICRKAWRAAPPTNGFVKHRVKRLTVHHTAVLLEDNRRAPDQLRAFQADHQARGWADIAYHLLIDLHGNVYRGRPAWAVGDTSTTYDPAGHLLVTCLGNFEAQAVPAPQLQAVVDVLAWACARFGVSAKTIRGHRDYVSATACPGADLYRYIDTGAMQRAVALKQGHVAMSGLCGRAGRRRVRRIENGTDGPA